LLTTHLQKFVRGSYIFETKLEPKSIKTYKWVGQGGAVCLDKQTLPYGRPMTASCRWLDDQWLPTRKPGPISRRPVVAQAHAQILFFPRLPPPSPSSCPHFWAHVVNSSSMALAHAHPARTSPKIFKHP
jgi:hypothetical protein